VPTATTVRANLLVLDWNIYPRQHLDDVNLRGLRDALDAGEQLPPVHVDAASSRVIDGFHRVTVALRADPDAAIAVTKGKYADDAERFLDAVRRNARHGARLRPIDQARCVNLGERLHVDPAAVAGALGVSVDKTAAICARRTAYDDAGAPVELKRPLRHLAGTKLSRERAAANRRSSGWPARFHAEQILLLLGAGLIDYGDEPTSSALEHLYRALAQHFTGT